MHMTFEKIEPDTRHPALKAALMIKELHKETIALIDGGQVFMKDGIDVSADMRAQCAEQIVKCDELIEYAKDADPAAWKARGFAGHLVEKAEETVGEMREAVAKHIEKNTIAEETPMPEIGNYGHET